MYDGKRIHLLICSLLHNNNVIQVGGRPYSLELWGNILVYTPMMHIKTRNFGIFYQKQVCYNVHRVDIDLTML